MRRRSAVIFVFTLLLSSAAFAKNYFDAYQDGLKAAANRDWNTVVQKMTEAIAGNAKEGKVRPYGTIFEEYHPYYYRGIAYFELERFDEAIADLRKATGPGKVQLGDASSYIGRAETKLAAAKTPPPGGGGTTTTTTPPIDTRPAGPDPAIAQNRSRADQMLRDAQRARDEARNAKAETYAASVYSQGSRFLESAGDKRITASTADEWRAVADDADKAQRAFVAAAQRARDEAGRTVTITESATTEVVNAGRENIRNALELYFAGDFNGSAKAFQRLANASQKDNSMVWAFLGAARYYNYYLTGSSDATQLSQATEAFKNARKLNPSLQLSTKYFSPRVRNFYKGVR